MKNKKDKPQVFTNQDLNNNLNNNANITNVEKSSNNLIPINEGHSNKSKNLTKGYYFLFVGFIIIIVTFQGKFTLITVYIDINSLSFGDSNKLI